jgi:L-aminoadipate-semialdehyde dehydrogenase
VEEEAAGDEIPFALLLDGIWQRDHKKTGAAASTPPFKVRFFDRTDTNPHTLAQTTMTDLTIIINTRPSSTHQLWPQVQVQFAYNQVLFSQRRIEHLAAQLIQVVEHGAGERIGYLNLVTELCRSAVPNPVTDLHWCTWPGAITQKFITNARAHPQRPCVVEHRENVAAQETPQGSDTGSNYGGNGDHAASMRTFNYDQIRRAALRVCEHLIRSGVEREDVVVIYAYRGVDLVVAIMGVLMAGATFSVIGK